ncbi:MAG: glycosyltransferase family 4 protein [Armatimonadetes bacterium]|nr:glycosyltransferase family 4 protein [Akkermansiaceae bacterium]
MIWLFSDYLSRAGGIETYLHALGTKLVAEGIPFRIAVSEMERCPFLDEFEEKGVPVYRQGRVPGDRWRMRQHVLCSWLFRRLKAGDWVYCVRQPQEQIYERLVKGVHRKGAKLAASWMFTPDALKITPRFQDSFNRAVAKTDAVISVSQAGAGMYREWYGYLGPVKVVRYHNLQLVDEFTPISRERPWRFGFIGRLDEAQKNLIALIDAFAEVAGIRGDVTLEIHGDGPDRGVLEDRARSTKCRDAIHFHGRYDHRFELPEILSNLHCVVYTSRFEGGPCFSLLEAMQAGRFVLASAVGGIPDLYAEHPEAGLLVHSFDKTAIRDGLEKVLGRLDRGDISVDGPRALYESSYTMEHAHRAWCEALEIARTD